MIKRIICTFFIFWSAQLVAADLILKPVQVSPNIYAVIGGIGGQSYENDGLNSNLGFVVTPEGVVVINSGPSTRVAKALHAAIRKITSQPVKWVINVNSQSHYWFGNAYFQSLNIPIIAHKEAGLLMHEMGEMQLASLKGMLKDKAAGTQITYPSELFQDKREIKLGGVAFQLISFGSAHTAGDMVVWLPEQKVLFSGDLVFTERLLAVIPLGNSGGWVKAFDSAMALGPKRIVPGHGKQTNVQQATRDTRDYLAFNRMAIKKMQDKGASLQEAVEKIDQSKFRYLVNFDLLSRRNVNQIFTEMEQESF